LLFLLFLAAGVAAAIVLLKLGRRRLRYLTGDPRRIATACSRDLADFLLDQRLRPGDAATLHDLEATVSDYFGVDAAAFTDAATTARYGPLEEADDAARRARLELRSLKRRLRRNLVALDRARGLVSVRSLGLG
jgi:hypothetical protein